MSPTKSTKVLDGPLEQTVPSASSGIPVLQLAASFGYWLLAHLYFLPGLYIQRYSTLFALSLAAKRRSTLPRGVLYRLLTGTLDSTSYFEFDFAWKSLPSETGKGNYLDVHSPWLLPLLLIQRRKISSATLVSNDGLAIPTLRHLLKAASLDSRCHIIDQPLESCSLKIESFDFITSICGLAEVNNDSALAAAMWRLLKPAGRLVVSLPCATKAAESAGGREPCKGVGPTFGSSRYRLYNSQFLRERIFSVLGEPQSSIVYGTIAKHECANKSGAQRNLYHPSPREPIVMAREWRCFSRIEDLPGEGIIAMAFTKPPADEPLRDVKGV